MAMGGKGDAMMKRPGSLTCFSLVVGFCALIGLGALPDLGRADTNFSVNLSTPNGSGGFTNPPFAPPYGTVTVFAFSGGASNMATIDLHAASTATNHYLFGGNEMLGLNLN